MDARGRGFVELGGRVVVAGRTSSQMDRHQRSCDECSVELVGSYHSSSESVRVKRLIKIGDDVIDVFDADAEPNRLRSHSGLALLFSRHLSMSRRGWVASQ